MIDGQENPVFAIQEMSFYEVIDWMIFAKQAPFITTSVTNLDFFKGLPAERQQMVLNVVAELNDCVLDVQRDFNRDRLELIRQNKPNLNIVTDLTPQQREAFRSASQPIRERFVELAGPEGRRLLEELIKAIKTAETTRSQ